MQPDAESVAHGLAGEGQASLFQSPFTRHVEITGPDPGPGRSNGLSRGFPLALANRCSAEAPLIAAVLATSDW